MTRSAWIFMLTVWLVVLAATVYCFAKLLTSKQYAGPDVDEELTPPFGGPEDERR